MGNNDGDDNKDIIMDDVLKLNTTKRRKNGVHGEAAMRVCKSSVTHEYRGKKKLKRLCFKRYRTEYVLEKQYVFWKSVVLEILLPEPLDLTTLRQGFQDRGFCMASLCCR